MATLAARLLCRHYESMKISQEVLNESGYILVFNENNFQSLIKNDGVCGVVCGHTK